MMADRGVMNAYGSAAGFAGVAHRNLTLSRRAVGRAPADPARTAFFLDDRLGSVPGPAGVAAARTPPPAGERVEVAEP